jgi:hypothetical protein
LILSNSFSGYCILFQNIIFQIQFKSKHLANSMFKVTKGVVEALESPFSNREDGQIIEDIVQRIPGQDYEKMRQGQHMPINRAFPPAGGFV